MNKRLTEVASLVDKNKIVVDIGCDHAYLPIYLIKNNITNKVLAIDNKIEPLNSAIKNIKKEKMEDCIIPILSDGLTSVNLSYDLITICGMGGETIIDILSNKDIKNKILVLEPNNNHKEVREFLNNNLFSITDEKIIKDKNIYYQIIKAKYSGKKEDYSLIELTYGKINLKERTSTLLELINKQKDILLKALAKATNKKPIEEKILELDKIIKGE